MKAHTLYYRTLLEKELQAVQALMLETLETFPPPIAHLVAQIVNNGGKRLRPALVLLSAYLHGADLQKALPLAAAVELLHTATLVHDDLIDNAEQRRGTKTLNAHLSPATTVLAGDIVFAWAAQLAARGQSLPLMARFSETLATICQGELKQMLEGRGNIPTQADYYARIFAKTASLFALTTETGAILAGHNQERIQQAWHFGKLLGEAFQIVDDVLDFMGDEATLGKPVGGDLRQGLITLPVLYYLSHHPADQHVQAILDRTAGEDTLQAFVHDLQHSNAAEQAMAEAETRIGEAVTLLDAHPPTPYRQAAEEIARFSIQRRF